MKRLLSESFGENESLFFFLPLSRPAFCFFL
jgi:hypothetical protein